MQIDVIVDEKRAAITLRLRARRCRPKLCQDYPEAKLEVLYLLKGDVALLSGRKPSYAVEQAIQQSHHLANVRDVPHLL